MKNKYKLSYKHLYIYKKESRTSLFSPICKAPFSGLLFIPSGKVMACHYNRGTIIGNIRENEITDLWNSEILKKLRKHISHNDFSFGCQSCYEDIVTRNILLSGNYKYKHTKINKNKLPAYFDFQLENTCNLNCVMCSSEYSSAISNSLKLNKNENPYNDNFIAQLEYFIPHLKAASFTGGEPFVIKSYRKIWQLFKKLNPQIPLYISTNASFIPNDVKELISNGNFHYTVSIDSLEKATYEEIRVNANFEKTLENISFLTDLAKQNKTSLSIKTVIMTLNYKEIPNIIEYWSEKNINIFPKLVWVPVNLSLKNLPLDKLNEIIDFYKNYKFKSKSENFINNYNRYNSVINQIVAWRDDKELMINESYLNGLSLNNLKVYIINEFKQLIINDYNYCDEIKPDIINNCNKWINEITDSQYSEFIIKNNLIGFIQVGADKLLAEIIRNPDDLKERFTKDNSILSEYNY